MKYEINKNLNCVDLELNGATYRISSVKSKELISNDVLKCDAIGECDYFNKQIRLSPDNLDGFKLGDEKIQEVLLHEIAHAWLDESGQNDINDERIVEIMSRFALRVIRMYDNDFIDFIYKMHDKTLEV